MSNNLFPNSKPAVLVSKCWTDEACRYHGRPSPKPKLLQRLAKKYHLIFVCPEQLGGLPTPRPAAPLRFKSGQTIKDKQGRDLSMAFIAGAEKVLVIAKKNGCRKAYLVKGSPSCDKSGFAGELLVKNQIKVINY